MNPNKHSAFTLMELLAVIAVLAVLLLLLFPVVGLARERSASIKCLANIRSYGTAVFAMVADKGQLRYWDGLGSNYTQTGKPQYNKDLTTGGYLPENPPLRCPLAENSKMEGVNGRYRFPYAGNINLCHYYPNLKGVPAPLFRVVLAGETNDWDGFDAWTSFNNAIWNGGEPGEEGSSRPMARYHGTKERRGLNFFFLDGSARLLYPKDNDWKLPPIAAPLTGVSREGYFYHSTHFANLANGKLIAQ